MDDPRVLRIITVGLVLAILAVVYFMLTGRFAVKPKTAQTQGNQVNRVVESPKPTAVPTVTVPPQAQKNTTSAYDTIANRAQGSAQTLPNTGFPFVVVVVISASAVGTGFALRKFPR